MRAACLALAAALALLGACASGPAPTAPPTPTTLDSRTPADFEAWRRDNAAAVRSFEAWLREEKLTGLVPLHQLLRTASMWSECKGPPYEVAPQAQWASVKSVLQLVQALRGAGVLGEFTVHSAYRNPSLNECAGGARRSAHMVAFAIDITPANASDAAMKLCEFWRSGAGPAWAMGFGRYPSGRLHIDTHGHRTWGADGSSRTSPCQPAP
jgi:hypothetical protein